MTSVALPLALSPGFHHPHNPGHASTPGQRTDAKIPPLALTPPNLRQSHIERIKWLLWHNNLYRAVPAMDDLQDDVEVLEVGYPLLGKFARAAREFAVYITSNTGSLINYGKRFRAGERMSSCLAKSTVNAVVSKRFAKRQQMQWTPRGAHLLLQTRTRTLDGTLRPLFERWYPGLANDNVYRRASLAA